MLTTPYRVDICYPYVKQMLPNELTSDLLKRLASIQWQIGGIIKMVNDEKQPDEILVQFKAAQNGLERAQYLLLDEVFRKSLALKLVNVMNACPGNCPDAEKIEYIKQQFPSIVLSDLASKINEINDISTRLKNHNENFSE